MRGERGGLSLAVYLCKRIHKGKHRTKKNEEDENATRKYPLKRRNDKHKNDHKFGYKYKDKDISFSWFFR